MKLQSAVLQWHWLAHADWVCCRNQKMACASKHYSRLSDSKLSWRLHHFEALHAWRIT